MKTYRLVVASALFGALAAGPAPVEAAAHGGGHSGGFHGGAAGGHVRGELHDGRFHQGGHMGDPGRDRFHGGHFHDRFRHGFVVRPRFDIGFGFFAGYPFDYPFYSPWDYWNYPVGPLAYAPGQGYGGVSFSISPGTARIIVDGAFAGTADEFDDPQNPLNLPPGQHHIEIEAPGYATRAFDVDVQAGQITPYVGDLTQD